MAETFPIFFPTYTPMPAGYDRNWWWYDPELAPDDQGPFVTRSETVSDWAIDLLVATLLADGQDLDRALALPMLRGGQRPVSASAAAEQASWARTLDQALAEVQALDAVMADPLAWLAS